ncbi:MAG TPA: hypothetical protein PK400_01440 [Phycisphaerales bacterium]|nr:hypothetical protein [Phycisphaerales bacterium]
MTTLFRQMLAGGACAIAVCAATDSVNADDRFLTASGGALTVVPPIEAQRIQTVNVNFDLLRSLRSNDQFSLPIYDKDYRALVTQKEENGESLIMSGHLFGDTLGQQRAGSVYQDSDRFHCGMVARIHTTFTNRTKTSCLIVQVLPTRASFCAIALICVGRLSRKNRRSIWIGSCRTTFRPAAVVSLYRSCISTY